jgi:hypothetical protein
LIFIRIQKDQNLTAEKAIRIGEVFSSSFYDTDLFGAVQ